MADGQLPNRTCVTNARVLLGIVFECVAITVHRIRQE